MNNQPRLVEIARYDGVGYAPVIDYASWRVAILNEAPEYTPSTLKTFERHDETDEVFVALAGRCVLYVGDGGNEAGAVSAMLLEEHTIYNVKRGVWHAVTCGAGGKMLIVENRDTTNENSVRIPITDAQRARIVRLHDAL